MGRLMGLERAARREALREALRRGEKKRLWVFAWPIWGFGRGWEEGGWGREGGSRGEKRT